MHGSQFLGHIGMGAPGDTVPAPVHRKIFYVLPKGQNQEATFATPPYQFLPTNMKDYVG